MLALDAAPHHFKTAPRVVNGPVPAGEDCLGPREGEVRALLSRGQPRSAPEIHLLYAVRRGFDLEYTLLNANDELLRSWPALCSLRISHQLWVVEPQRRKCGATRRRRPT